MKSTITETKRPFLKKESSSKRLAEVWKTVKKLLKLQGNSLSTDNLGDINLYFTSTASRNLDSTPSSSENLLDLIIKYKVKTFSFHVSYTEAYNEIENLQKDYSTGDENIPVWLLKQVTDVIVSPLT